MRWGQRETRVRTDTKSIVSFLLEGDGVGVGVNVRHGHGQISPAPVPPSVDPGLCLLGPAGVPTGTVVGEP